MAAAPPVPLTAASYNIRKAVGADLRRRPDRILRVIDEIAPDIVVLQEADRRFGRRHTALPAELLEAHGLTAVPLSRRAESIGWHGNAILVRGRVRILDAEPLDLPALEPRGAVVAELEVDGCRVRVVGMHLDLSGLWRRRQARAILAHIARRDPMPTLLMGDLNEWRPAGGCIADFGAGHHRVVCGLSFPARRPMAALDRIFVSRQIDVEEAGVHRSATAAVASDHLPLWVRLRLSRT